jgi:energy-coupling factor transport system substrate-specific component
MKRQMTPTVLAFIPFAVGINLGVGAIVQAVKLPIFLDSIGTVLVGVLAGPLPAILTGLLTVVVGGIIINPVLPYFATTAIVIGWWSGFSAKKGAFRSPLGVIIAGVILGVLAGVVSAPVIVVVFGGVTQSGSSIVVAYLMATGKAVLKSVILAGIACEPVDKTLTCLFAWALLRGLPSNLLSRFPTGSANLRKEEATEGR